MNNLPKILIVEDDPLIAEDLNELCLLKGYDVCPIAYNVGQAIIQLEDSHPQLAILDINLNEELDGVDLAGKIEEDYKIPYLFITSYSDVNTLERVHGLNHQGYIVKPFNKNQLYATLELAWNQSKPQQRKSIESWLEENKIQLTGRELDVFQRLIKGETVTALSAFLEISPNTSKYYIKKIYTKLEVNSRATFFVKVKELNVAY